MEADVPERQDMTLSELTPATDAADTLRAALGDRVLLPGDPAFDQARTPWNLAVAQHPFAVALPESAEDVVDIVRAAVAAGLRVAPQSTGHAAAAVDSDDMPRTVLVSLVRLRGVVVDPSTRTARLLGGSLWNDVLAEAAPHGLTALHGSAGDVSVVGYALSGGLSFYARGRGLAVNSVRAVQIVTADGALRRASADENPELFWAVRGGSGAFGIVVSIEIDLLALPDVYAGMLLWPVERAAEVAHAWAAWTTSAPETATTTLRVLNFPPMPELPPFLSGRSVVVIDGAIEEADDAASALLAELRALTPEMDTFARIPAPQLVAVHMDPAGPTPALTAQVVLDTLPPEAVDAFVSAARTPGLFVQELRHIGGAAARRPADAGAIGAAPGQYVAHAIAMVPAPEAAASAAQAAEAGVAALRPWRADRLVLTFVDSPGVDPRDVFGDAWARLRAMKEEYDPAGVFLAAHPV
jgi:FAD/FMN-containing dehydrogenase